MALRLLSEQLAALQCRHINKVIAKNCLHTSATLCKSEDRRQMKASLPAKDEGTIGERTADIDSILSR